MVNASWLRSKQQTHYHKSWVNRHEALMGSLWNAFLLATVLGIIGALAYTIWQNFPIETVAHVVYLGLITALRVFVMVIVCSIIWVPIGVWIGLRPGVAEAMQPVVQFVAAFPANLLYPIVVVLIVKYHLNVDIWVTPLMILGVQWYILFNVIAGASVLPKDLLQVADNLGLGLWLRWRRLILPGIFPYFITGAITAVGGAWNASIAAEVVSWGDNKLVASGLGAYISEHTLKGDFTHTALGIGVMVILVLFFNRLVWRPLYVLAQSRYQLD
jgi:NitT/TauT family transport system permease protein